MSGQGRSLAPVVQDGWDWFAASDPGLNRLRMASRGVVAMGTALGLEWLVARYGIGRSSQDALIAMLLGAIVAMMGSMGLSSGRAGERAITAAMFPAAIGVGMVVGAAVAGSKDLMLAMFVIVLFAAVYVRKFGQRFFFAGFMVWMGYFFASFLGASFGQLPWLILYTAIGAAWVLALSLTVLQENAARTLRHTLRAFATRAEALADASADALDGRRVADRRLQRARRRMNETALMVEGQLADDSALPEGWSAHELRRWLTDAELAVDAIAFCADQLARAARGGDDGLPRTAAIALQQLADGNTEAARRGADRLTDDCVGSSGVAAHASRRLADAVRAYTDSTGQWSQPHPRQTDHAIEEQDFTPSVVMMMGRLPNSNAVARDISPRSATWNPLARLPMTTRQAIQVAVAGGLAILAGRALSEQRYYWAVIAAFVAFTGTATRGDTFVKAANRVIGTAAGLVAAILVANLTAGNTDAVLAVILASMFLGFYLQQISYAFMIFFITIMVAQLYSVLNEFSDQLLVLRLEETAIGAAIGILVAVLVLPVSTTDTSRAARSNFYTALQELLEATAERLSTESIDKDLDGLARTVNNHLYQLRTILQPLTTPLALRGDARRIRHRLNLYAAASMAARAVASAARPRHTDPDTALAQAARHLAAAAEALAGRADPDTVDEAADRRLTAARGCLDAARDRPGDDAAGEQHLHPLQRPLDRMLLTLQHLTDRSDAAPPKLAPMNEQKSRPGHSGREHLPQHTVR